MKLQKKTLLIRERDAQRGSNRTRRRAGPAISWPASSSRPVGGPLQVPLADLLPVWPGPVLLVSLVRAVLRVLRQLAFLVLPASGPPVVRWSRRSSGPGASLGQVVRFAGGRRTAYGNTASYGYGRSGYLTAVVATPLLGAPWRLCLRQFQL